MKRNKLIMAMALTAILSLGLGSYASAQCPMGYGQGNGKNMNGNYDKKGGRHHGGSFMADLDEKTVEALKAERTAFRKSTEPLKQMIYQKKLELQSELAKQEINVNKATFVQKELSDLKAKFDIKRLEHIIAVKKISPLACRKFMQKKSRGGCMK